MPDRMRQEDKDRQIDFLMKAAAHALAREILDMDGVIQIQTDHDISTLNTRIVHSMRVVIEEN
jgi:hypothetical protein